LTCFHFSYIFPLSLTHKHLSFFLLWGLFLRSQTHDAHIGCWIESRPPATHTHTSSPVWSCFHFSYFPPFPLPTSTLLHSLWTSSFFPSLSLVLSLFFDSLPSFLLVWLLYTQAGTQPLLLSPFSSLSSSLSCHNSFFVVLLCFSPKYLLKKHPPPPKKSPQFLLPKWPQKLKLLVSIYLPFSLSFSLVLSLLATSLHTHTTHTAILSPNDLPQR